MPCWIRVLERIVEHIAVPIQRLRLARARHNGIRAHEPPKQWIVIARVVIVQAAAWVVKLLEPRWSPCRYVTPKAVVENRKGNSCAIAPMEEVIYCSLFAISLCAMPNVSEARSRAIGIR
jgi:hypothetical protein